MTSLAKGKQRAADEPTETSPLLGSSSEHPNGQIVILETSPRDSFNIRWQTVLRSFLIGLGIAAVLLAAASLVMLARLRKDVSMEDAVRWKIDDIAVLNASAPDEPFSLWIDAKASIWLDFEDQELELWQIKALSWGMRTLRVIRVSPSEISIHPQDKRVSDNTLLIIEIPPFDFNLPQSINEKQILAVPLHAIPTSNVSSAVKTIEHSWTLRHLDLVACVPTVNVRGIEGWSKMLTFTQKSVEIPMSFTIPPIPFLPLPPAPLLTSFASLLDLSQLRLFQSRAVSALGSIPNPLPYLLKDLPTIEFDINPTVTATIYLPPPDNEENSDIRPLPLIIATPLPMTVSSSSPNLTLPIQGVIHSIPNTPIAELQVSTFLSTYLGGLPSPLIIHVLEWWIPFDFPPPSPKPKILEHISLHDMRIAWKGDGAVVNGNINVIVSLPPGIDLDLEVKRVTVDLIAFDGPVPAPSQNFSVRIPILPFPHLPRAKFPPHFPSPWHGRANETQPVTPRPAPPAHAPPHPLPSTAFARIRPQEWLNSTSTLLPEVPTELDDGGPPTARYEVKAAFENVPLDILPGRDSVFRAFVRKFLFSREAEIGLKGFAGVGVLIPGLIQDRQRWTGRDYEDSDEKGVLELLDIPVESSVLVSKGIL